jgi:hypothetical protein
MVMFVMAERPHENLRYYGAEKKIHLIHHTDLLADRPPYPPQLSQHTA